MTNPLIYLLFLVICSGFTLNKNHQDLSKESYTKEIPFNYDYGVPIINAQINGKTYRFLFDTGMPTALSETITKELNLKSIRFVKGTDVNGNSKQEDYVMVDEMSVGGIPFKNIETLSIDLKAGFEIGCLNIDGIVGNNLIKTAIWEIDYQTKILKLTDNIDNLNIPEDANILKFTTNEKRGYYSPNVTVKINKKKRKGVKFDTGSNGALKMPLALYLKDLDPDKSVTYFGKASAAIYGKGDNKTYMDSKVNSVEIGELKFEHQIVTFNDHFPTIGNKLLENYRVIINYFDHKIYMIQQKEYTNTVLESFGFEPSIIDQKQMVSVLYKNSQAELKGLQLGDEILEVNAMDIRKLIAKDPCGFLFNNPIKDLNLIKMTILRNGEKHTLTLEKKQLID